MHVYGTFTLHHCTRVVIAFAHAAHLCVPLKLCVVCTESNKVHKDHLMSSSSPSLLETVIQGLLSMTDPTHILLGRLPSLHAILELL